MISAIAACVLLYGGGTVEMSVMLDGTQVGSARITQKLTATGGKSTQTRLDITQQGKTATVIEEAEYEADGTPVRKYLRKTGPDGIVMRVATFDAGAANLVLEAEGKRETRKVFTTPGANIRAASELWLLKTQPKVNDKASYTRFDMDKLEWKTCEVTYQGIGTLKVAGQSTKAHLTEMKGVYKAWLSDDGLPIKMVAGRVTFERSTK